MPEINQIDIKLQKGKIFTMANQLFNQLMGGLRNARSAAPEHDTLAMGFTKTQMLTMNVKKPRLIWYDAATQTFYDQGDSTKIKKSEYTKINSMNFKKSRPMNDLQYYIPINNTVIEESNKPLD